MLVNRFDIRRLNLTPLRHILMSKVDPRTEKIKKCVIVAHSYHSNEADRPD